MLNVELKVSCKKTENGGWIEQHEPITVTKQSIDKAKAAFSNALARQGTPFGSALKFGAALFFVSTVLTYAVCAKRGGSKWLTTVPAIASCLLGLSSHVVSSSESLLVEEKHFLEKEKESVRALYYNCGLKKVEHVATRVESADWKFTIPVWVIEKGE